MLGGVKELLNTCELLKLSIKVVLSADSTALLAHVQLLMPLAAAKVQSDFTASSWLWLQAAQQLMGLRGNGSPMSIPEDDKMWMMIESSYHSLEFDYAPTPEQV